MSIDRACGYARVAARVTVPQMRLRSYQPSDLSTLHEIDQACFPPDISYSREELVRFIDHRQSVTWVAEEGGRIAGFLVADRQSYRAGHIITIDVAPGLRRRGVGTVLMDKVEEWARAQGLQVIYLETSEQNTTAQKFYGQRGYRKCKTLERYYGNGDAALVMVKWLNRD